MLLAMSPGQRSRLFSEVNDRIYELLASADPDLPGEFLCECGRDCGRRVELLPAAFATIRAAGEIVRAPDCPTSRPSRPGRRSQVADGVPALS